MRLLLVSLLCFVLTFGLAAATFAEDGTAQDSASAGSPAVKTIGGVPVVSPEKFGSKLNELGEIAYRQASPITDMVAKLSIATSGLLLILLLVLGAGILRRVVGAVFAVAVGLGLWYGAPYIVGLIKSVAVWLQS
ncbi:MAG: hypothetical protein AB1327_11340 [Bacillota bacterium]